MSLLSGKLLGTFSAKLRSVFLSRCSISVSRRSTLANNNVDLSSYDPEQVKLLDEMCIIVDTEDKAVGSISKKDCHLMANINKGMVHRAFSVYLFNSRAELLIQQRADTKITFPGLFTNTCCSHPLHTPEEMEERDAVGVKRAALRRLNIELGIPSSQLNMNDLKYVTRFQYKASSSNPLWGESELAYIFVVQKDVDVHPNPNEIKSLHYVAKDNLSSFLESPPVRGNITPWFQLVTTNFLNDFWYNLRDLSKIQDHNKIHMF